VCRLESGRHKSDRVGHQVTPADLEAVPRALGGSHAGVVPRLATSAHIQQHARAIVGGAPAIETADFAVTSDAPLPKTSRSINSLPTSCDLVFSDNLAGRSSSARMRHVYSGHADRFQAVRMGVRFALFETGKGVPSGRSQRGARVVSRCPRRG